MPGDPGRCLRDLAIGLQGLALLRHAVDCPDGFSTARRDDIRHLLQEPPGEEGAGAAPAGCLAEIAPLTAYASWAPTYDSLPNGLIEVEEPAVHALVDAAWSRLPGGKGGRALDAACGTGRHAAALVARGYATVGVDESPAMLAVARSKVPHARFETGQLEQLPLAGGAVDLAVCALAFTHLPDISAATAELARVVVPGGRIIISDPHPMVCLLQSKLLFAGPGGRLSFMRYHTHLPGECLATFAQAGLTVVSCQEPLFNGRLPAGGFEEAIAPAARAAWEGIPAAIVWELERRG